MHQNDIFLSPTYIYDLGLVFSAPKLCNLQKRFKEHFTEVDKPYSQLPWKQTFVNMSISSR